MKQIHLCTVKMLVFFVTIILNEGFSSSASPKVELPATEVVALPGYKLWCKATGTPPIHTSLMWGSQLLDNSSGVPRVALNMEGKYTCKATSQAGTDSKTVNVIFTTCPYCSQAEDQWYSHWGNTLSCSNVRSSVDLNCASSLVEVLYVYASYLQNLPADMFASLSNVRYLFLASNNVQTLSAQLFSCLKDLVQLDLSSNAISVLPQGLFSNLTQLSSLNLSSNNIATLDADVFSSLGHLDYLSLSFNKLEILPDTIFTNLTELQYLDLSSNRIRNLTDGLFCCVKKLQYLFLQNNQILGFNNETFGHALNLKYLLLNNNSINVIPEQAFLYHRKIEILMFSDNIIDRVEQKAFGFGDVSESPEGGMKVYMIRTWVPELNLYSFHDLRDHNSELTLNDELVGTLRYYTKDTNKDRITIYLNPTYNETKAIEITAKNYERADLSFVSTFLELGFTFAADNKTGITQHFTLLPCPEGTYSMGSLGCVECPPGGFVSDSVSYVAQQCERCPVGAFVSLAKQPGTRYKHCRACPRGTNTERMAGLFACNCLDGFYRTNIFGKCFECEGNEFEGLDCSGDYLDLKPGYWWAWQNYTHKERYRNFTSNINNPSPAYDPGNGENFIDFAYPMPKPTKCPRERSCSGGVASLDNPCEPGYEGPVCGICSDGYYKQIQACRKCPTKTAVAIQLGLLAAALLLVVAIIMWYSRKNVQKKPRRALIDIVFARLKIIIGFYQVTYGLLEAFSFVRWPDALEDIAKYSEVLQLNFLQMAPLHCLIPGIKVDAFGSLFAAMGLNAVVSLLFALIFWLRKLMIRLDKNLSDAEKSKKISHTKELVYRNLFFFLFVTYLSTCSKTANVLPPACRRLCIDREQTLCDDYLKADYGIKCRGSQYHLRLIAAYVNLAYIFALPAFCIIILWRQKRVFLGSAGNERYLAPQENKELVTGLRFLYENYRTKTWYWEVIEMARKIALTSGLILVGGETRVFVGVTCVLAALYGMAFAYYAPIQDYFENNLMVSALSVTFVNLGIGAVSRIPAENRPPAEDPLLDTLMFKITVIGANTLVIGQLVGEYFSTVLRFVKQWIRHPYFSITCCQTLLLPVNDMEEDSSGFVDDDDDDDLKSQLETEDGRLEMTSTRGRAMNNEGLEVIVEETEIEKTGIRPDKTHRARSVKKQRVNDVDLGIGSSSNGARVDEGKSAVTKVEVHDVNVEVHGGRRNLNEATEEVNVEMREQEAQTELSLLEEMDQEAIEQLGFAYDETLCQSEPGNVTLSPDGWKGTDGHMTKEGCTNEGFALDTGPEDESIQQPLPPVTAHSSGKDNFAFETAQDIHMYTVVCEVLAEKTEDHKSTV